MRGKKPVLHPLGEIIDLPLAKVRVPPAPDWLDARAKKCWEEVAAILVAKRIYDDDCKHTLAGFCVQYGRFLYADEMLKKLGLEDKDARLYLKISNQAYDRMMRVGAELGLTAVSRKRVARNLGGTTANKFLSKK